MAKLNLYKYRFELFFISLLSILFGELIIPGALFEIYISPILFQLNIFLGIVLISKKKKTMWFLITLMLITGFVIGFSFLDNRNKEVFDFIRISSYFLFYIIVTVELIKQVWHTKLITKNVFYGVISGYISLGLIGFFLCLAIELSHPNSYTGIYSTVQEPQIWTESLMYYSYVTLLTIGYGEITPITSVAKKTSILIGLMGQFYLVIVTAIIVGKFISQSTDIKNKHGINK